MRSHCHIWRINIKRVQAKQLSSAPPLKSSENLWFSDNSREFRSQIIHSNAPMDESSLMHQVWTITLVFSSKSKILLLRCSSALLMFHYSVVFWFLPIFCCSVSVPVFRRFSVFRDSVFRCSWYYSMRVSEGEDGFINSTWRPWFLRKQHQHGYYWNMYCVFEKVELSFFQGNTVNTMLKPYQILRLEQEYV